MKEYAQSRPKLKDTVAKNFLIEVYGMEMATNVYAGFKGQRPAGSNDSIRGILIILDGYTCADALDSREQLHEEDTEALVTLMRKIYPDLSERGAQMALTTGSRCATSCTLHAPNPPLTPFSSHRHSEERRRKSGGGGRGSTAAAATKPDTSAETSRVVLAPDSDDQHALDEEPDRPCSPSFGPSGRALAAARPAAARPSPAPSPSPSTDGL